MKELETSQLVKMDDLNHHGTLFVGKALTWLCETGFITASMEYKDPNELVFFALNGFKFFRPVQKGDIVTYRGRIVNVTKTSISCYVYSTSLESGEKCAEGLITYVTIDKISRKKKEHGLTLDETNDTAELDMRKKAANILEQTKN